MKALLLCQNLNVGGAEELVLGASTHLPARGVETGVVAITRHGPVAQEIARAGVPVHDVAGQPGPRDPAAFGRLVRLLRREQPDVVHTYLLNANLYGRLAAMVARVPLVVVAEQNVYHRKRRRHAAMERALARGTYRVVACCRAVGDFYRHQTGVPAHKMEVVYNAVRFGPRPSPADRAPALASLGLPADAYVVGTLGRLTEQKGHAVLLRAVSRLAPRAPRLAVFIAGQGPLRASLEAEAESLGVRDRVHLVGMRRDRETLYAAMDLFVLPSLWEGLSLALVEAMGAGRPIVATDVGGNPEVLQADTGQLVRPNDPEALARAIEQILHEGDAARRVGTAAAKLARSMFSIEQHAGEIAALYRRGLAERNGAGRERGHPTRPRASLAGGDRDARTPGVGHAPGRPGAQAE
jgi:glycosyltransferase involved in cell wall biosynthesis